MTKSIATIFSLTSLVTPSTVKLTLDHNAKKKTPDEEESKKLADMVLDNKIRGN